MIVSVHGRSGSTYMYKQALKLFGGDKVSIRCDVPMAPGYFWQTACSVPVDKPIRIYPNEKVIKFHTRRFKSFHTNYIFDKQYTIEENYRRYFDFIQQNEMYCQIGHIAPTGILKRLGIADVIFIIRHPLHHFVSWLHPTAGQHGKDFANANGYDALTDRGIKAYARFWNDTVRAYLDLKESGLNPYFLRFEYLPDDVSCESMKPFAKNWDGSSRHYNWVSEKIERKLRELVKPYYHSLYERWKI